MMGDTASYDAEHCDLSLTSAELDNTAMTGSLLQINAFNNVSHADAKTRHICSILSPANQLTQPKAKGVSRGTIFFRQRLFARLQKHDYLCESFL